MAKATPGGDYPVWAAVSALKAGLSARAGLAAFREAGGGIRDATWFKLYAEAKASIDFKSTAVTAPLDRKPISSEIFPWPVANPGRNYAQFVDVWARDRTTGQIVKHAYQVASDELLTVGDVIATAVDRFGTSADDYDEEILGATYAATYIITVKP